MKGVTIIGLNAVWQKVIPVGDLQPGAIHRCHNASQFFSGKGGNVAVSMERLGHQDIELVQALGGDAGKWALDDMGRFKIRSAHQCIGEKTRVCTTLIESDGRTTELIEPSPKMSDDEWSGVGEKVSSSLEQGRDLLVCGSFPEGDPSPLIEVVSKRSADSHLWVDGIREDVLRLSPEILKINDRELASLVTHSKGIESDCAEVSAKFGIQTMVITAEGSVVSFWDRGAFLEIPVPPLEKIVNTTGAGDTFLGALVHTRLMGWNWRDSIERAIEWAALRIALPNVEDLPYQES